jgi:gamma-glutamyltranspeptidase/glutathione hydrolase
MTPAILLGPDRRFAGAIGSPGGNAILAYVGKATVGMVDWNLSVADALALPNLIARGRAYAGEATRFQPGVLEGLRARGVEVKPGQGEDSGLHGVLLRGGTLEGGADPRREGVFLVEAAPKR